MTKISKLFLIAVLSSFISYPLLGDIQKNANQAANVEKQIDTAITILKEERINERIIDFTLTSQFHPKELVVRITLPRGYFKKENSNEANTEEINEGINKESIENNNVNKRYPVLYLLHGGGENHEQWTKLGAEKETAMHDVILVQPEGGRGSWFRDAKYSSFDGRVLWESYFIEALIPWIDNNFRTQAKAEQRAIAGLSMGGYGAMTIAARHPEYFSSVSSFSGAVDISGWLVACWIGVSPFIDLRLPFTILGAWPFDESLRLENNPLSLAENLRGKHLAFYFGNGQRGALDDFNSFNLPFRFMGWLQEAQVHIMNVAMHQLLIELDIPHDYKPYGNGMHTSAYWEKSFREELPSILEVFEKQ